jgi:hypothetical protein
MKFQMLDEFLDSISYGNDPYGKQKLYVYLALSCLSLEPKCQVLHPSGLCTPLKTANISRLSHVLCTPRLPTQLKSDSEITRSDLIILV